MTGRLPRWRLLAGGATGIVALVTVALLVLMAWLNSDSGHRHLESMADSALEDIGLSLAIEGWHGRLPFGFDAESVELTGPDGPVLLIDDLRAEWRLLPLLWGRIRVDILEARSVLLARRPPQVGTGGGVADDTRIPAVPRLLLNARLSRLALDRVEIGEDVLGQRAVWRVAGEVGTPAGDGRDSYLDVARIDDRSDQFRITTRYRPGPETLELQADWEEGPGGFFAGLIAPDSPEGLEFRVSGDGPLDAWQGRLSGRIGGAVADLSCQIEVGDESRVALEGRIDAAYLMPPKFSMLGAADVDLSVAVRNRERNQVVRVSSLHYRTSDLTVSAQGSFDRRDGSLGARVDLVQSPAGNVDRLLAPVSVAGLKANVTVVGSLEAPGIETAAHADRLAVAGVVAAGVELHLSAVPRIGGDSGTPRGDVDVSVEAADISWSLQGMERLIRGPARARLSGLVDGRDGVAFDAVTVELPDARVSGEADLDLAGQTLKAPLHVTVTDLDALDSLTHLDLEGAASLDVDLVLPAFDGRVEIGVAGQTREFSLGLPVVRAIVSPEMELQARLAITPRSGLQISEIRIGGSRANVTGRVSFPADYERMEISAQGRMPDAAVLSPELALDLSGPAEARAELSGPTRNPRVEGTIAVAGVVLPAGRWTGIRGKYSLADLAERLHGPVSLSGDGPAGPTEVQAELSVDRNATDIQDIRASVTGLSAAGHLVVPHTGGFPTGVFDVAVQDFGPAMKGLLDRDGGGRGAASLNLGSAEGGQDIRLALDGEDLTILAAPDRRLSADLLHLEATMTGAAKLVSAKLEAANVAGPSSWFPSLKASANGNLDDLQIGLETEGRLLGAPAAIDGRLQVSTGASGTRVTLARLAGTLDALPLESRRPATLLVSDGRIELGDLDLRLADGEIRAAARLGGPDAAADASVTALPLGLLRLVDPSLDLQGTLDARIDLRATSSGTAGAVDVELRDVLPQNRRRLSPISGQLHGRLSSGQFVYEATAATSKQAPVTVTGELPLDVDLVAIRLGLVPQGRLRGRLDWSGDAMDIFSLLPLEDHLVSGPVSVALDLSGTMAEPRVAGRVEMVGGRYEHLFAGTVLSPLHVVIEGDGKSLNLSQLSAGDEAAGTLTGSGHLSLDPEAGFPLQAALEFQNLVLVRRDEITGRASGTLSAAGPLSSLAITGQVQTNEVEVGLVNNLPPQVVVLEITEAGNLESGALKANGNAGNERRMVDGTLAVDIAMPSRVFLRGLGLDSEWQGHLNVRGTIAQPELVGRLESIRGVLMFFGRRFRIDSSSLVFTGGRKVDPELNVRSIHEGRELTVNLQLTGPISNPDLSLSSSPPLPEDEILARALFGKSAGQLTAVEAVQLAAAVSELTMRSSGPGVLARLREAVGVDVLRFGSVETAEGEQATTFEAGRYVTEGLYVGVETSTVEEGGGVTVEYEISRRVRLTTDIKQTGGQNIGVEYKKDY